MDIRRSLGRTLCLLSVLLSVSSPTEAAALPPPGEQPLPADMSRVHFYLLTMDVSQNVWDNFGHTALRVYDESTGSDLVFNWGVFDTGGSLMTFLWDFFKGGKPYRLEVNSPAVVFDAYRSQRRTLWQDRINLSTAQKERLYRRLMWNLEPGNVEYAYHYFDDNCTTKVRDYLNEAVGGGSAIGGERDTLESRFAAPTPFTHRDEVRAHYASIALIRFTLDIIMNGDIDRPISEWEAMFIPQRLRQGLLNTPSDRVENGSPLNLLSDSEVIMEFPPPRAEPDPYPLAAGLLLLPTVYLLLMIRRTPTSWFSRAGMDLKFPRFNFRLLGLLGLITALFSGIYGCLMLGGWFLSSHQHLHHNINLLLFWPTDLIAAVVAVYWLATCRSWPMSRGTRPLINYYLLAHGVAMAVYAVLALSGWVPQEMAPIAFYVMPGFLLYTVLIGVVGFAAVRPGSMYL